MDVLNHCSDLLSSDNYRLQKDALLSPNAVLPTLRATTPEMCSFFLQRSICVVWIKTCIWLRVSYPLYESEIAYTSVCGPSALQAVQEHRSVLPTVMAEAVSETLAEDCVSDCFSSHECAAFVWSGHVSPNSWTEGDFFFYGVTSRCFHGPDNQSCGMVVRLHLRPILPASHEIGREAERPYISLPGAAHWSGSSVKQV